MDNVKEIDTENRTYYFHKHIINIKNLDPNKIKIEGNLYKTMLISYIGYMAMNSVNHL